MRNSKLIHTLALGLLVSTTACGDDDDDTTSGDTEGAATGTDTTPAATSAPTTMTPTTTAPTTDATDPGTTDPMMTGTDSDGETDPTNETDPSDGDEMAMLRVIHLAANADTVDIYPNEAEEAAVEMLEFQGAIDYVEFEPGTYTFDIAPAGTSLAMSVAQLTDIEVEAGMMYTVAAIGDAEPGGGQPLGGLQITDNDADIDAANIRLTIGHAASSVGEVDIWNVTDPENPATLLEDVPFGVAATLETDLPAAAYTIGIDADDDMDPDLVFEVDASTFGGSNLNVFANDAGSLATAVLVVQPPEGAPVIIEPEADE